MANRLSGELIIPEYVTSIGKYAFKQNWLYDIKILNSVISIGICAFTDNRIHNVTIPHRFEPTLKDYFDGPLRINFTFI